MLEPEDVAELVRQSIGVVALSPAASMTPDGLDPGGQPDPTATPIVAPDCGP